MRKSFVVAMLLAMVLNILIPVVRPVATRAESVILPSHVVQDTKNHLSQVVRSSRSTTANADGDSVFAVSLPIYLPSTSWTETSIGASTVPVSITESGFDPATVIVTVGTTVEWTNRTGETQQIVANVGGYEIFLPLVLRNASSTLASVDAPSLTLNAVPLSFSAGGFDWSSGPLAPGESYTYTFITTGDFSYFLSAYPDLTGVVIVQEEAPPDFDISITPAVQTVTQGETTTYTVTLTAVGGFASPVTLSATGLPVGATADWSQNPATPDATVVLTVTTAPSTSISDHLFTVTGMGGGQNHNAQATLTVKAAPQTPDFELGAWPATQTITRGHSINYTVAVTAVHGFTQAITLDAGGYTTGTAIAWTTNPLTPTADTTLTITPSASGPTGTFTLVITGTSNPVHTTQVELVVVEKSIPPVPDFFLNVTPRSRSIVQGQTTSYDVALTAIYGFTNTVSLEVGGLPAGATPAWDENPLTPSASTVMTVTTADTTPTGNYTLVITGTGGGISRTDSVQLSVNPPPMPNLVVRSIETDPEVPVANQPFEIQVGIANTGTAYALGDFLVDWYADPSTPPISTTSGDGTWTRSGLGTGRTILLTTTYTLTTAGTHTFYAQIDRTNVVTESDEMDNLTGPLTLIASVMPQPDLVVIGLSVAPTIPTLGQPVTLTVQIKNRGTLSTTADVRVDGYVDPVAVPGAGETGDVFTTIASLDPGQSVVVQLPYTFTTGEQYTIYAQVDALDVVSESIENNNVSEPLTVTPYVPQPDLVTERILLNPVAPFAGDTVTATVTIRNQGDTDAGPFRADWYVDPASPPVAGQTGDGYWNVPSLAVGAAIDLTLTHSFAATDTHWIYVQVDPMDAITESVETNNVGGEPLTVVGRSEDVCGNITADTTWYANTLYRVICDVTVMSDVTLTVNPGVVAQFGLSNYLRVYGTLNAVGTSEMPVLFTSSQGAPAREYWGGVMFENNSKGYLEYIIVEYGNSVYVQSSDVQITNSTIRYSKNDGISISNASPEISDSIITDNDSSGVRVSVGSPVLSGCIISNNDYLGIDIDHASPTVSGCTIAYNGDNGIDVFDSGSGSGENSSPIISGCSIANNNGVGIDLSGIQLVDGLPVVSGNTISSNADYAVRVKVDKLSAAFANANTFSGNGQDAVYVLANGQYLTGTHTWPSWLSDYPLHISERFSINSSGVLVIEAGVRLELTNPISYPPIRIYGTLNTLGTTNNPVVFTRQTGIANWGYMSFEGMSGGRLDYTIIEYGSGIGIESSDVQIANSIIRYSKYSGISINNASPEISDSVVTDNDQVGIRINRGSSIISGCIIVNNDSYGIDIDYASPTVSGCTIAYNGDNGIDVFDSGSGSGENSSPIISGCSIANNNGIGIDLSGIQLVDSLPVVSGNTISSNADYAVRVKVDKLSTAFANANTFSENGEDAVYVLANGQYLTGTHTWPSWLSDYPLHISERFSINSSGVLVIEAGVRLELVHNMSYPSVDVYGTLRTLGTSDNPVIFTRQGSSGNWSSLIFREGSRGVVEHTIIEYAGAISIKSDDVHISHSTIRYGDYDGISIGNASPKISDSIITDNDQVGIRINRGSSIISGCTIVNNGLYGLDIDYASPIVSDCTIAYNGDNGIDVSDSGSGSGENSSPIISGCSIANNNGVGIDLSGIQLVDGLPVVSGNTISGNTDYAVRVKVDKLSAAFANTNTFSENGEDAVYVLANGQYLTGTHTWPSWLSDYPLHISERFRINSSGVLVIEAGVRLELVHNLSYPSVDVYGTLRTLGTSDNPVIFTRQTGVTNWGYMSFEGMSGGQLDYTIIEYGSGIGIESSDVQIANSIIRYSKYNGISISNASPTISHNDIYDNSGRGISTSGDLSLSIIRYNNIYDNGSYGLYNNAADTTVNARNNWWGDTSGPYHPTSNPDGDGNRVSSYVDFEPWLGQQTQESEDIIETALPEDPVRDTEPAQSDVPHIESIESEHGFFLFGTETYGTELTVNIDWNGSEAGTGTIGIAEFRVGRQTFSQAGDENGVIYDLPISSLKPGINNVEIVAVLNNGTESKVHTVQITRFLASTWLYGLGFNDTFQVTVKPDYVEAMISVKFPPQPFEVNVSSVNGVPFLNNTKKPKKPEIGLDLSLRSDSKGTVKIYGNFPFCFAGAEASFNPSGKGTLYFDEQGRLGVENGLFQAKGKTKIKLPKVSLVRVVAQGIPLDYIADVYLQTTVEPSLFVQKGFKYAPSASTIEWQPGGQLGGDLKLTLELVGEVLKGLIQVTGYGGGSAGVTFQVPPNPEYLYQVRGSAFLGLKFKALGLIKGDPWETKWEYSYKPGDTLQSPVNITTLTNIDTTSIRVVEWDEEDWHVEQRDYGKQPYARFVGGIAPLMVRNRQVNSLRATTTPLVTNLYAQANPDLALREDQALLLWAHDDVSLPESQSKEILSSWWNGATWSTPISVTDNTMSEFNPQVALVNGNQTLAVWERIDDPAVPMTATLDVTLTNKVELAYAVFDFDSQTWNTPALLTDNQVFDHVPQLAANGDGQVMAVWRSNVDGELLGSPEHPDALNYAIWDGSAWSITGTITDSIGDLLVYSVAYSDTTHATVVLNRDQDGDQTTHEDIELFATEWNGAGWNTPTQLTDNSVADENPTVLYTTSGERRLIWMQGTRLAVWHDDWSVAPTLTDVEDGDLGMMNFAVALDDEDNLMLIWRDYSDAGQDLFHALYNAESATWSLEAQLTDNEALEKDFTAAFDPNGQLMVAYAQDNLVETNMVISPTLTISDVTTYDSTDLYILHYIPNTDLTITDLSLPEYWDNPWPGDTVNVYATVRNSGDWAVVSPTIALYDGNPTISGTLIATATVTVGPLAGGVSEQVSIQWTVPLTPVQPHTLYAVIDPSDVITETDEVNNVISLTTTLPDVAVSSVKAYYYDQHNIVPLAMVANNGPITATDILVEFREGTVTGTVRHSHTITQLAPYGLTAVTTTWNVSTWGEGDYTYYVVLDSGDTIIEVNETDNWDYFPIKVLPDLVIYSGDVQASLDPVTGGPVTVTVRNWGIADAANVQVALYEGPVITTAATALYTWTVPSLPVDGDVILNTTIDHRPNRLFAIADPSRVITEVEEYNNVALTVQPISVTLRYHNLESVIPSTATVTLNGNWTTNTITLTNLADVYSVTLHIADTPLRYRYAVDGDIYLLNTFTRTVTPTVSTVYDDYRNVFAGWAQLDGPTALTTTVGTPTAPITAQVYISDVTPLAGSGATIHAEIGYGTSITLTEWIWSPSAYTADMGDNDQFAGVITPTLSGTYSYTVRFDGNWGASNPNSAWLYADLDGTDNGFSLGSAGMLTVP